MLWEIRNTPHKVLGSIHFLPQNVVLPEWLDLACTGIKRVVLESDLEKASASQVGIDRTGQHLRLAGVSETYEKAKSFLSSKGISEPFDALLPWRVAFFLTVNIAAQLGYSADNGIEKRLRLFAVEKRLALEFLETPTRVLELIHLSCVDTDSGLAFLKHSLARAESGGLQLELQKITRAWFESDLKTLSAIRSEKLDEFPSLLVPLILQRDQEMGAVAARMAADEVPTLFVVGALHTVGGRCFNQCLADAGFCTRQMV